MTNYNFNVFYEDGVAFKQRTESQAYRCAEGHLTTIDPCYICHSNEQARKRREKMARAAKRRKASV